jgi:hypothetical protein
MLPQKGGGVLPQNVWERSIWKGKMEVRGRGFSLAFSHLFGLLTIYQTSFLTTFIFTAFSLSLSYFLLP